MTTFSIAGAQATDLARLVEGNQRLAQETEDLKLNVNTLTRGVRRLLEQPELGQYFVARHNGHIAGQCMITTEWSDWRCEPMWWFQSVYVWPEFRRRGVFSALHQHVCQQAQAQGVSVLRLYVEQSNASAQATYKALGLKAGHYEVMEQDLAPPG